MQILHFGNRNKYIDTFSTTAVIDESDVMLLIAFVTFSGFYDDGFDDFGGGYGGGNFGGGGGGGGGGGMGMSGRGRRGGSGMGMGSGGGGGGGGSGGSGGRGRFGMGGGGGGNSGGRRGGGMHGDHMYESQTGHCVHMRGLPFAASEQDILDVSINE